MKTILKELDLVPNSKQNFKESIAIKNVDYSSPYWLTEPWGLGMYTVKNQSLIGSPESSRPINIQYNLIIGSTSISYTIPVVHRFSKRDKAKN